MDIERECIYCGGKFKAPKRKNEKPELGGMYFGICPTCQPVPISQNNSPGQPPFLVFLSALKLVSAFCVQYKWCLKCPLDMSRSTLPGGMASPNRCLLLDTPANWNHDLIKERLEK